MILQRVSINIVSGAHNLRWTKGGFCLFYGPGNWSHCYSLRGIVIWIRNKFRRVTSHAGAARGGDLNIKCLPVRNIIIMTARRYNCLQLFIGADPKNILTSPWSRASHWIHEQCTETLIATEDDVMMQAAVGSVGGGGFRIFWMRRSGISLA